MTNFQFLVILLKLRLRINIPNDKNIFNIKKIAVKVTIFCIQSYSSVLRALGGTVQYLQKCTF